MALSKAQLKAVDKLKRGGHIWTAAGDPFIFDNDAGRSVKLNRSVFGALVRAKVIKEVTGGRWIPTA